MTFGGGGGGGGGYTVGADILSSADWYHHSIICTIYILVLFKGERQGQNKIPKDKIKPSYKKMGILMRVVAGGFEDLSTQVFG